MDNIKSMDTQELIDLRDSLARIIARAVCAGLDPFTSELTKFTACDTELAHR